MLFFGCRKVFLFKMTLFNNEIAYFDNFNNWGRFI